MTNQNSATSQAAEKCPVKLLPYCDIAMIPGGIIDPNVYVAGEILIDGVPRPRASLLQRKLRSHRITANVLTHVHGPTQGSAALISQTSDVPVLCGKRDLHTLKTASFKGNYPRGLVNAFINRACAGPAVDRAHGLSEGDEVAGFTVVDTPGHSIGHISLWRERDGVLIGGDVVVTRGILRNHGKPALPPKAHTLNMAQNVQSLRKIAELRPRIILPAHGQPIYGYDTFRRFCDALT